MIPAFAFSLQALKWSRTLFYGSAIGAVLGFLVGSAAFRWGPAAYFGKVFLALLVQPPLTALLLIASALTGGILLGRYRPLKGWVEGLAFLTSMLIAGLLVGGLVRLAAGPETPEAVAAAYNSATGSFLRIWSFLMAELLMLGLSGFGIGLLVNGLRQHYLLFGLMGALVLIAGFVVFVFTQSFLFPFAFPGGL
jgi:hypothetical protein